jgi:hypothetical protein
MTDRFIDDLSPSKFGRNEGKRANIETFFRGVFTDATALVDRNPRLSPNTQVVTRDLGATNSNLRSEARGHASINNRGLVATQNPKTVQAYKDAFGIQGDMSEAELVQFLRTVAPTERSSWKMGGFKDKVQEIMPSLGSQSAALDKYYDILAKGGPKNPKQQQFVDLWNSAPKGNVHVEDGVVYYSAPYASSAKDLGGVPSRIAIDTRDNNKVYSGIADGHDIGGIDPAGGDSLINLTPIQANPMGGSTTKDLGRSESARLKEEAAADALYERTGIERRGPQAAETMSEFVERTGTTRLPAQSKAELAEATGIPFNKGETLTQYADRTGHTKRKAETDAEYFERAGDKPVGAKGVESPAAYEKRVWEEYKPPVTTKNRVDAVKNGMMTGVAAVDSDIEEQLETGSVWGSNAATLLGI